MKTLYDQLAMFVFTPEKCFRLHVEKKYSQSTPKNMQFKQCNFNHDEQTNGSSKLPWLDGGLPCRLT